MAAFALTPSDVTAYEARELEDRRAAAVERLELHRRDLLGARAEFDIIAPRDTVDACDHLVDVINDVIWHCADDPRADQARCPDGVRSFGPAVERFRACVRRDLGVREPE